MTERGDPHASEEAAQRATRLTTRRGRERGPARAILEHSPQQRPRAAHEKATPARLDASGGASAGRSRSKRLGAPPPSSPTATLRLLVVEQSEAAASWLVRRR